MVLTTHAVVGGAIGRLLAGQPLLAFILAFASHFVLDLIPHWDYPLRSKTVDHHESYSVRFRLGWEMVFDLLGIGADLALGLLLAYVLFPLPAESLWWSSVLWGAVGGILPDGLQFIYSQWRWRILRGLQRFHHFVHAKHNFNHQPWRGAGLQAGLVLLVWAVTYLILLITADAPGVMAVTSTFKLKDALDIFIVASLIYFILIFIRRTRSFFIINSVIFLFALYYLSRYFDLTLTRQAFQSILTFFLVIFVVVFQREIRRFFEWLSLSRRLSSAALPSTDALTLLCRAVAELARKRIGAIIVLPGEDPVERYLEGGYSLDGRLSLPLLLSIFDPSSPGHDGAILVVGERVKRFGVHLPLADNLTAASDFGTRHRAAVGITERTDALAVVVSEERGTISVVESGELALINDSAALLERLGRFTVENLPQNYGGLWHFLLVKNFWTKLSALLLSALLWLILVFPTGVITQDIAVPIEFRFVPEGLVISDLSANSVTVTATGRNRDLLDFDPEQIKVVIDLSGARAGYQGFTIEPAQVNLPSYLSLVKVEPRYIDFNLTAAAN